MPYASAPILFTPDPAADNGPALTALLVAGERWIQIAGDSCPIGTTVVMWDNNGLPTNNLVIEPAPGIEKVLIDVSGIGRDPVVPSNPSYAAFDYDGNFAEASFLTAVAGSGSLICEVDDGSLYTAGDWILVSDASTDPQNYLLPVDGPMEIRQIVGINGDELTVDRAWKRSHAVNVIVALAVPFFGGSFRGLQFTGNATVGVHMHMARGCQFSDITTTAWRGGTMLLVDGGGADNIITDCYCEGVEPGGGSSQNAWGVSLEGQDGTRLYRSGGQRCSQGVVANYCIDTLLVEPFGHSNTTNIFVGFQSLRTNVLRPYTATPILNDLFVSGDSIDCQIFNPQNFAGLASSELGNRQLPIQQSADATDYLRITTIEGEDRQLLSNSVVARQPDGSVSDFTLEIKSPTNYSGNFKVTNTLRSWLFGMLGAAGSENFTIVDLTAGFTRFSISATGSVSYGGNLNPFQGGVFDIGEVLTPWRSAYFNAEVHAFGGFHVATNRVVGPRRTGWAGDTGTAKRSANATYAATAGATYNQAAMQALMDAVRDATQTQKAIKDDLTAHGLIGT